MDKFAVQKSLEQAKNSLAQKEMQAAIKYAKQVAMSNYPDIIQCGDAFDLRHPDWTIGY